MDFCGGDAPYKRSDEYYFGQSSPNMFLKPLSCLLLVGYVAAFYDESSLADYKALVQRQEQYLKSIASKGLYGTESSEEESEPPKIFQQDHHQHFKTISVLKKVYKPHEASSEKHVPSEADAVEKPIYTSQQYSIYTEKKVPAELQTALDEETSVGKAPKSYTEGKAPHSDVEYKHLPVQFLNIKGHQDQVQVIKSAPYLIKKVVYYPKIEANKGNVPDEVEKPTQQEVEKKVYPSFKELPYPKYIFDNQHSEQGSNEEVDSTGHKLQSVEEYQPSPKYTESPDIKDAPSNHSVPEDKEAALEPGQSFSHSVMHTKGKSISYSTSVVHHNQHKV